MKALIFDVDGTLAETEEVHRLAFNAAFAAAGLPWVWDPELYRELLMTTGGKERIAKYQERLAEVERLDWETIKALHKDKTARYTAMLAEGRLELRPGVRELVAAGRAAGLALAVATTTSRPNIEALTRCCWGQAAAEVFDVIAAGDEVAAKKPAPDVFQLALERLDLPAEACLAFEDSPNGLASALGAGLRVVLTPSPYGPRDADYSAAMVELPSLEAVHWPRFGVSALG